MLCGTQATDRTQWEGEHTDTELLQRGSDTGAEAHTDTKNKTQHKVDKMRVLRHTLAKARRHGDSETQHNGNEVEVFIRDGGNTALYNNLQAIQ